MRGLLIAQTPSCGALFDTTSYSASSHSSTLVSQCASQYAALLARCAASSLGANRRSMRLVVQWLQTSVTRDAAFALRAQCALLETLAPALAPPNVEHYVDAVRARLDADAAAAAAANVAAATLTTTAPSPGVTRRERDELFALADACVAAQGALPTPLETQLVGDDANAMAERLVRMLKYFLRSFFFHDAFVLDAGRCVRRATVARARRVARRRTSRCAVHVGGAVARYTAAAS